MLSSHLGTLDWIPPRHPSFRFVSIYCFPSFLASALISRFTLLFVSRCWISQPRLTKVLWKSLLLWNSLKRVKRWAHLSLPFSQSLESDHSHTVLLSSLFMTMDRFSALRCLISQRMILWLSLLMEWPWSPPYLCPFHSQPLQLHPTCSWMHTRMSFLLL